LSNGISESSDWATSNVKPEYIVEAGDVIFAWSASLMVKVWDSLYQYEMSLKAVALSNMK
jgi:hypothetical protein